ncbi:hypothetical protein V7O61_01710 [Methanolobus sp. WCC1]|nr:hypothetical protein [Methanolobus tindarius]
MPVASRAALSVLSVLLSGIGDPDIPITFVMTLPFSVFFRKDG